MFFQCFIFCHTLSMFLSLLNLVTIFQIKLNPFHFWISNFLCCVCNEDVNANEYSFDTFCYTLTTPSLLTSMALCLMFSHALCVHDKFCPLHMILTSMWFRNSGNSFTHFSMYFDDVNIVLFKFHKQCKQCPFQFI